MDMQDFLKRLLERMQRGEVESRFDFEPLPADDDDVIIIALPVDTVNGPFIVDGSVEYPASCGHAVWLSTASQLKLKQRSDIKVVCTPCMYQRLLNEDKGKPPSSA